MKKYTILLLSVLCLLPFVSLAAVPTPDYLFQFEGNYQESTGSKSLADITRSRTVLTNDTSKGKVLTFAGGAPATFFGINHTLPSSFTKSAWIAPSTSTGTASILSAGSAQSNDLFVLSNSTSGGASGVFGLKAGVLSTSPTYYAWSTSSYPIGQWRHVVLTYDNQAQVYKIYQNGVLVGTSSSAQNAPTPTGDVQYIGNIWGNTAQLLGKFDNVALWDEVLTPAQVLELYNGDLGIPQALPPAPQNVIANPRSGAIDISWDSMTAYPVVTDYIVEYRDSSIVGSSWNVLVDGVSNTTTATITNLINTHTYDIRVKSVNSMGSSQYSQVYTVLVRQPVIDLLLSTGQSLSVGVTATAILSPLQRYNNLMLSTTVQSAALPVLPLVEKNVETPSAGLANTLRALNPLYANSVAIGLHGVSGAPYSNIKKGTAAFQKGMTQLSLFKNHAQQSSSTLNPIGVTLVHGEADYVAGLSSQYEANMMQLQSDYQQDINFSLGTNKILPMFFSQMNTAVKGDMAWAQLSAFRNNPSNLILIGPKYQLEYSPDNLHLSSNGSRYLGELYAKVIDKVAYKNQAWSPLAPTSIFRDGKVITVKYNTPVEPIVIDTINVAARPDYGFQFSQFGGTTSVTIDQVSITAPDTIEITLSDKPDGREQKLLYASSCYFIPIMSTRCGSAQGGSYVGGNIRDSDSVVSPAFDSTKKPLYNWSVAFNDPVMSVPSAPVDFEVLALTGGLAQIDYKEPYNDGNSVIKDYYIEETVSGTQYITQAVGPYTISGLTPGNDYTFVVYAVNALGAGDKTDEISIRAR